MRSLAQKTADSYTAQTLADLVSEQLSSTRTVCKKYYVHPEILSLYESSQLEKHTKRIPLSDKWLSYEEKLLLKILKKTTQKP